MRHIDMETWPRREHFQFFRDWDYPHFNMCANVDVTSFYPAVKRRSASFTVAVAYVLARTANEIPEFRHRIRSGEAIEHEVVHPATTILGDEDMFGFCTMYYDEDFDLFAVRAAEQVAHAKEHPTLTGEQGQDDLLYMSPIPWVSFTSCMHPLQLHPADSIPRFVWGKFFVEGESLKMPLSVQGHHALMDGLHIGRFFALVQDYLYNPDLVLGGS